MAGIVNHTVTLTYDEWNAVRAALALIVEMAEPTNPAVMKASRVYYKIRIQTDG